MAFRLKKKNHEWSSWICIANYPPDSPIHKNNLPHSLLHLDPKRAKRVHNLHIFLSSKNSNKSRCIYFHSRCFPARSGVPRQLWFANVCKTSNGDQRDFALHLTGLKRRRHPFVRIVFATHNHAIIWRDIKSCRKDPPEKATLGERLQKFLQF